MRRLAIVFLLAQTLGYPQDKPKVSREIPVPQAAIPTDTDSRAWTRDLFTAVRLAVNEEEIQLQRRYERIDFTTYDRLITNVKRQREAYYKKWRDVRPDVGEQFASIVNGRLREPIMAKRKEYFDKYGAPKGNTGVPSEHGPTIDDIMRAERSKENMWRVLKVGAFLAAGYVLFLILRSGGRQPRPVEPPKPVVSDTHGTADWAKRWTGVPNPVYLFTGVFFGKSSHPDFNGGDWRSAPGATICSMPENHSLVVAKTRTGKGTRVIVPTLLRYMGSMIVIDPKGENAAITARARKMGNAALPKEGLVFIINPWGVLGDHYEKLGFKPAKYNPLEVLDREDPNIVANAQTIASTICMIGGSDKDMFWQSSAANILAAVLLWITDRPDEHRTLAQARMITSLSRKDFTDRYMIPMAASEAFDGAIRELISPYLDLANETYSGIMANLSEAMKFMSDPQVKANTSGRSFSMKDVRDIPITVYVVIPPERMQAQRAWLRLVLAAATLTFKNSPMSTRDYQQRCMFLIDEFPSLGHIPNFTADISTMAGYGVDYTLVVQGLNQLKEHYKDGAGTILSNCAYKWFCNVNDLESAKYLSDSLGKKTVQTIGKSESEGQSGSGLTAGETTTLGETGRNLLNPDEIMNLGRDTAILLNPLTRPHYLRTVDYWDAPDVFLGMRENWPQFFWKPPMMWDENPYIPKQR